MPVSTNALQDHLTPLHYAARNNAVEAIEALLKQPSIDIEKANKGGCTPLVHAFMHNSEKAAQQLIAHGANMDVKTEVRFARLFWLPSPLSSFSCFFHLCIMSLISFALHRLHACTYCNFVHVSCVVQVGW
jgi:hypothetical protein